MYRCSLTTTIGMRVPRCAGFGGAGEAPAGSATFFVVADGVAFGVTGFFRRDSSNVFSLGTPSVCATAEDSPDTAQVSAKNAIQDALNGGTREINGIQP
jgi:hypothetical protein